MNRIGNKPLGLIMNVVEAAGFEVTYAYDDLVFVSHNAFLLKMDDQPQNIKVYFNQDSTPDIRKHLEKSLVKYGQENGLQLKMAGLFSLEQSENDELKIVVQPDHQQEK